MKKTKKEHIVPRLYIKNFSDFDDKVYEYNVDLKKIQRKDIRDTLYIKYFYDFDLSRLENDDDLRIKKEIISFFKNNATHFKIENEDYLFNEQLTEKFLSIIENEFAFLLQKIIVQINRATDTEKIAIKDDDKRKMSIYISIQFMRSKTHRDFIEWYKLNCDENIKQINKNSLSAYHSYSIINEVNTKTFSNLLSSCKWVFFKNNTKTQFCTSDNPVIFEVKNSKYLFYFPISRNILLIMYSKNYYLLEKDGEVIEMNDEMLVRDINIKQYLNCSKSIISGSKEYISYIENIDNIIK